MGVKDRFFLLIGLLFFAGILLGIIKICGQQENTADPFRELFQEDREQVSAAYAEEKEVSGEDTKEQKNGHIHDFVKSVWEMPTCSRAVITIRSAAAADS